MNERTFKMSAVSFESFITDLFAMVYFAATQISDENDAFHKKLFASILTTERSTVSDLCESISFFCIFH